MNGPPPLRISSDDPEYRRQAIAEEEFWRRVHPGSLETTELLHDPGPLDRHLNRCFSGDAAVHWSESIAPHGPFVKGAFLGTSAINVEARILETNPRLHLTFYDLSDGGLSRRRELLGARFPGRVGTRVADLNFIELPIEGYDVIISSSTTHHVTNLESLAFQINRALVPGGYFFVDDYVGEARFQFAAEKKRVYTELVNRDRARHGRPPAELVWLDTSDLSPFCGVRSPDILPVFGTYLDPVDVRTTGALTVAIMRSRPDNDANDSPWVSDAWTLRGRWQFFLAMVRRSLGRRTQSPQTLIPDELWSELHLLGEVLTAAGLIQPGLAFARYRKR